MIKNKNGYAKNDVLVRADHDCVAPDPFEEEYRAYQWEAEFYEEPYEEVEDEDSPKPPWEVEPPLGILSRGPVWSCCPYIAYIDQCEYLCGIFLTLSLAECEELVEFLCGLDHVCIKPDCEILTRDYFRSELIGVALVRRDYAMARRQRDLLEDPTAIDNGMYGYIPPPAPPKNRVGRPRKKV